MFTTYFHYLLKAYYMSFTQLKTLNKSFAINLATFKQKENYKIMGVFILLNYCLLTYFFHKKDFIKSL